MGEGNADHTGKSHALTATTRDPGAAKAHAHLKATIDSLEPSTPTITDDVLMTSTCLSDRLDSLSDSIVRPHPPTSKRFRIA